MYSESLEAFQTAIIVYQKLNLKIHQTFAIGDYFLSKTYMIIDEEVPLLAELVRESSSS